MRHATLIRAFYDAEWAILPDKLLAIEAMLLAAANGETLTEEQIEAKTAGRPKRTKKIDGKVAVVPVFGTITHRANMMNDISGGTSIDGLAAAFDEAMNREDIGAVLLDIDSPGGSVRGVPELADKIFSGRGIKPIIAQANSMAASAAYWIGTAADELVITPSGDVGSIGVLSMHTDQSKMDETIGVKRTLITAGKKKAEGNPYAPLDDDAREEIQRRVDAYYEQFVGAVARGRGVSRKKVESDFGQGRMFGAKEAVELGMADRVATLEETLARLGAGRSAGPSAEAVTEEQHALRHRERKISLDIARQRVL